MPQGFLEGLFEGLGSHISDTRRKNFEEEERLRDFELRALSSMADKVRPEDLPIFIQKLGQVASVKGKSRGLANRLAGRTDLAEQLSSGISQLTGSMVSEDAYESEQARRQPEEVERVAREAVASGIPVDDTNGPRFDRIPELIRMRDPLKEKIQFENAEQALLMRRQMAVTQASIAARQQLKNFDKPQGRPVFNQATGRWQQFYTNEATGQTEWRDLPGEPQEAVTSRIRASRPTGVFGQFVQSFQAQNMDTPTAMAKAAEETLREMRQRRDERSARTSYFLSQTDRKNALDDMEEEFRVTQGLLNTQMSSFRQALDQIDKGTLTNADAVARQLGVPIPSELRDPAKVLDLKRWLKEMVTARISSIESELKQAGQSYLEQRHKLGTEGGGTPAAGTPGRTPAPAAGGSTSVGSRVRSILEGMRSKGAGSGSRQ